MDYHRPNKQTKRSSDDATDRRIADIQADADRRIAEAKKDAEAKIEEEKKARERAEAKVKEAKAKAKAKVKEAKAKAKAKVKEAKAKAKEAKAKAKEAKAKAKVAEASLESTSLLATLYRDGKPSSIVPITNVGTASSNINPKNHDSAEARSKEFKLFYLYSALTKELECLDLELEKKNSCYIPYLNNGTPSFSNEAEVQGYMNNLLKDATTICNILISKIAEKFGLEKRMKLEAKAESSLFSNVIDHVVVYDLYSSTPILAIETKKILQEKFAADGSSNKVLGQAMDQLLDMKLMGHPNPFSIITCHNFMQIAWLDSPIYDEILNSQNTNAFDLNRLVRIIGPLPPANNKEDALSQSPLKVSKPDACTTRTVSVSPESSNSAGETRTNDRILVTSEQLYDHEKNVDVVINAIFCSLDGFHKPRSIMALKVNEKVVFPDAIGMTKKKYSWDSLSTTCRGPLTSDHRKKHKTSKLYLVNYIGRGSTSKVYRCMTDDGYDCVAKIYVQRRSSDNKVMTKKEFQEFSDQKATEEFANLQNIYGNTVLNGYIWRETLNNFYCILMPFFEPIETEQRTSDAVMSGIRQQLQRFGENGKKFRKCDQLWRHVGYFQNEIFLFDLGDLIDIADDSSDDYDWLDCRDDLMVNTNIATVGAEEIHVETFIDQHLARLARKA